MRAHNLKTEISHLESQGLCRAIRVYEHRLGADPDAAIRMYYTDHDSFFIYEPPERDGCPPRIIPLSAVEAFDFLLSRGQTELCLDPHSLIDFNFPESAQSD